MSAPVRIQRKRSKGWRMPEGAVYVGRGSMWGNVYRIGEIEKVNGQPITPERAVALFRDWVEPHHATIQDGLRGRDLACWCPLDQPCHADVLLEIANT